MQLSKMKNIIVLKGMSSNVVDEAIVLLKPNVKIKQAEYYSRNKPVIDNKDRKMIVIKEAENTINNYVEKLQSEHKKSKISNLEKKYKFLQVMNCILVFTIIISAILIK